MNHFGELLLAARKRTGLTQLALAKQVDLDDSYISRMERGIFRPPSREVAVKLADVLGINDKRDRFSFLLAAGVASEEDVQGLKLVDQTTQNVASPGTILRSPVGPSYQTILRHRLANLKKKLAAVETYQHEAHAAITKHLQDVHTEINEIQALAAKMFSQE